MTYKVSYKLKGQLFWRSLLVKADTTENQSRGTHILLVKPDESCLLVPLDGTQIKYDKDRYFTILKRMEAEAGQKIAVKVD